MADLQTFTARNRRTDYSSDEPFVPAPVTRFASAELKAAPAPLPSTPPGPFGDLSRAPASEILRIVERATKGQPNPGRRRLTVLATGRNSNAHSADHSPPPPPPHHSRRTRS